MLKSSFTSLVSQMFFIVSPSLHVMNSMFYTNNLSTLYKNKFCVSWGRLQSLGWTSGLDWWTGLVDWTGGLTLKSFFTTRPSVAISEGVPS